MIRTNALRHARLARGWTQAELARRCGLSPAAISRIEAGERIPSLATLQRLLRVLGLPIDMVWRDTARRRTR